MSESFFIRTGIRRHGRSLPGRDDMKEAGLLSKRWDDLYRDGRYADGEPVAFVRTVVETLRRRGDARRLRGLYVGCGNGRNYVPLADAGLDGLSGIDVSPVAVDQLSKRRPQLAGRLRVADFETFETALPLDYIVAIQVFQHGDGHETAEYFRRSFRLLDENGLLFLRVNSSATDVYFEHTVVDHGRHGGFAVRYTSGPKRGLTVRFFAAADIAACLADAGFEIIYGPEENTVKRSPPQTGMWSQWEVIARKPAGAGAVAR